MSQNNTSIIEIQMRATEYYFALVLFIMLYKSLYLWAL